MDDITRISQTGALTNVMSLDQFKEKINSEDGIPGVEEALNLDEGNDPVALQPSQVGFLVSSDNTLF